jgi:hypothetical protein
MAKEVRVRVTVGIREPLVMLEIVYILTQRTVTPPHLYTYPYTSTGTYMVICNIY